MVGALQYRLFVSLNKKAGRMPAFLLVGVPGLEPGTNRLCLPLQLSLPLSSLRSGLSLHPILNLDACHTVSTPSHKMGLARDCQLPAGSKGFPEFDKIYLLVAQVSSPLIF